MAEIGRDMQYGTQVMSYYYNPLTGETYTSTGSLDRPPEGFIPMDENYTPGMGTGTGTGTGANTTYDPYAYSDIGRRALGGEYIDSMNFFWFDPVTGEEGQTTEGWSRVPDSAKPYTYLNPGERNLARNTFYESGAAFGGTGGTGGFGGAGGMGGGLLSGQAYAQQIAGGMPFEQVVAPGMSFSPDQPMGYLAEGATPFQPRAFPMTGEDLGLPTGEGTPMPAGTTFEVTPTTNPELFNPDGTPIIMKMGAGFPGGRSFPDIDELLKDIDVEQAIENLPTPVATPTVPVGTPEDPYGTGNWLDHYSPENQEQMRTGNSLVAPPVAAPVVSTPITPPPLPQIVPERQPVMPSIPVTPPVLEAPTPIVDVPINLGLPMIEDMAPVQIPEIPFQLPQISQPVSIPTLPVVNTPVMPQPMVNLGMTPTNPVLNIDNIVSPIRQGSPRALLGTL